MPISQIELKRPTPNLDGQGQSSMLLVHVLDLRYVALTCFTSKPEHVKGDWVENQGQISYLFHSLPKLGEGWA